jgi:hypothetical protein
VLRPPRQLQRRPHVAADHVHPRGPAQKLFHREQLLGLRAPAQRLAVGFAGVKERVPVAFEHGQRELAGRLQAAHATPAREVEEIPPAAPHRARGVVLGFERGHVLGDQPRQGLGQRGTTTIRRRRHPQQCFPSNPSARSVSRCPPRSSIGCVDSGLPPTRDRPRADRTPVFDVDERGPDEELKLQFEAVSQFGRDEKKAAKDLLDALILKHQARRWTGTG